MDGQPLEEHVLGSLSCVTLLSAPERAGSRPTEERRLKETPSEGICADTPVETVLIISSFLQSTDHTRRHISHQLDMTSCRVFMIMTWKVACTLG
ncbi:hypothetical protein F2P79_011891 [Pimephales promelas]|nr:hypothetical protein F2P79_011891 [Pimephales promelas]